MPLVAACKNQLVEKVQEQGGLFRDSVTTFAAFKTLWIHFHHSYIWQLFDAARLSVPVCFIDLNISWHCRLLMHRRFDFQIPRCGQLFKSLHQQVEQVIYFKSVIIVSQYNSILRSFINYALTDLFISHLIARSFALVFAMHEGHMHMIPTVYN